MKSTGRFLVCFLMFFLLTSAGDSSAQTSTVVAVAPSDVTKSVHDEFAVDVTISDVVDLQGASTVVNYDPDILEVLGVSNGPFLSSGGEGTFVYTDFDNMEGWAQCDEAILGSYAVSGSGVLVQITFRAKHVGESDLILSPVTLKDLQNQLISADISGGIVHVETPVPPPLALKEAAYECLAGVSPTGDDKLDKKLEKAMEHILKSLNIDPKHPEKEPKHKLWLDDDHLDPKHGKKVFDEEKKAVKDLMKEMKKKKFPLELKDDFLAVIVKLLDADQRLAQIAIDDAIDVVGKPKEIEKAQKEMAKAEKERNKDKYDKAIDHYKKAWEHAQKAMKNPPEAPKRAVMLPDGFTLFQNRPNPFNSATTIRYQLPEESWVSLCIYNIQGQLVRTLVEGKQKPGYESARWDSRDSGGHYVASGVYLYVLKVDQQLVETKKMALIR